MKKISFWKYVQKWFSSKKKVESQPTIVINVNAMDAKSFCDLLKNPEVLDNLRHTVRHMF